MGGAYKGCGELLEVNPGFDTSGLIPRTMLVLHEHHLLTRDGEEPLLVEHVPVARARSQQHERLVRRLVRHLRTKEGDTCFRNQKVAGSSSGRLTSQVPVDKPKSGLERSLDQGSEAFLQ
jgi:hypothetical protein